MQITLPDYATRFEALTFSVCFLDLKGVGDTPRQATGYFWRRADNVFLVTNWHNVTGINIIDGKAMANGWCPERFGMQYFKKPTPADSNSINMTLEAPTVDIPLYEHFDAPHWMQHAKSFDMGIDVVVISVSEFVDRKAVQCVNDRSYPRLFQFVGSDVFIVGHPIAKVHNEYPISFPVWKRGSIASEILVPWNRRPAFLVDARTSKGMSGSPVFSRVFGPAALGDGTLQADNILTSEFMGTYSGRIFDDDNEASIGMVWHRNIVDQILDAPSPGSRGWKPPTVPEIFVVNEKPKRKD